MSRSRLGDEVAFEELLHRCGWRRLRFTQHMLQSAPESVADVLQEIWIAVYPARSRLLNVSKFRSRTYLSARDRIYRKYRRRRWMPVESMAEAQPGEGAEPAEMDSAIDHEAVHRCPELISSCPD